MNPRTHHTRAIKILQMRGSVYLVLSFEMDDRLQGNYSEVVSDTGA